MGGKYKAMEILAHRGYWKNPKEKNSLEALMKAVENGYGIESDFRDYMGKLVISHNIADSGSCLAEDFFRYYAENKSTVTLALNVKADGIQNLVKSLLDTYQIKNYFLFDMSVPELVVNEKNGLVFYTRHSDIEEQCVCYEQAAGVWLDSFYKEDWLTPEIIELHLETNKPICIVSPELHGKAFEKCWKMLREQKYHKSSLIKLCTDIPDEARRYFNED